jgi:cytosine/adenosine deaminase-related metal-dependent hydrolase
MSDSEIVYRARKIYRPDGSLLTDGAVRCRDGRIVAVEPWSGSGGANVVNLGDALLLPGLVNAHTHLWLTHLHKRVRRPADFMAWLTAITWRVSIARQSTLRKAIEKGARQLLEGGVTAAVEIDYRGLSAETLAASPLRLVLAREILTLDPRRAEETASREMARLDAQPDEPFRRRHGLAPHAPYTVSRELWQALAQRLRARPAFLTIHLAESNEESQMIERGRGSFVRRFRFIRFLPRGWQAPGCSPVEYLESTGILDAPGIAAHCSTVNEADAQRLARHGWTVAFCPGTHEYFGRPPYPLEMLRRAGVPVCLGTDSAASNPTGLSMMAEMGRMARGFPQLSAREIVEAATTIPARAIGWAEAIGRIEPGRLADFAAWSPCPEGDRLDREWLAGSNPTCTATVLNGEVVYV